MYEDGIHQQFIHKYSRYEESTDMNKEKSAYIRNFAAVSGLACSTVGLAVNTSGLFYTPVANAFHTGTASVALMVTIYSFAAAAGGFLSNRLILNRNLKRNLFIAMMVQILTSFGLAFMPNVYGMYVLNGIRGLASGMMSFVFISTIINNWFRKSNGLIMSLAFCFSGIPVMLISPVLSNAISAAGWRNGYILVAVLILLCDIPAMTAPLSVHPEERGWKAYGAGEEETSEASVETIAAGKESVYSVKRSMWILFAMVLAFVIPGCIFTVFPQYYLPGMAESFGHTALVAGTIQSVAMAANIVSKLLFGFLADHIGAGKATVSYAALGIVSILLMIPLGKSSAALYVLTFTMSLCFIFPSLGEIFIVREAFGDEAYAKVYPITDTICSVSMALGNTMIGGMVDLAGGYIPVMIIMSGFMAVAMISAVLVYSRKTILQRKAAVKRGELSMS